MSEERMSHPDSTPRFDIAASGTLAYAPSDTSADDVLTLSWIDMEGNEQPLRFLRRRYREVQIAPNGRDALATISEGNTSHIWLLDLERETSMPLTAGLNSNSDPIWRGDGPEFVFTSNRGGKWGLYESSVVDSEHVEILYDLTDGGVHATSSSPDGHVIIFNNYAGGNWDVMELSLEGSPTVRPLLNAKHDEWIGRLSPDGQWLAYTSDESGENQVYLRSYPSMTGKTQLSAGYGIGPVWSPDGNTIYYRDQEGMIWAVPMTFDPQPRPDSPQLIYDEPAHRYAIHPDGDRFLVIKVLGDDWRNMGGREIVVVENWFEEVLRREALEIGPETN